MKTPITPVLSGNIKELFPEFFLDDQEPNNRIWNRGVIVFDANVLLNLYELSSETASKYLAAMATCQGVKTFSWTQQGEGNVFIRTEEESR